MVQLLDLRRPRSFAQLTKNSVVAREHAPHRLPDDVDVPWRRDIHDGEAVLSEAAQRLLEPDSLRGIMNLSSINNGGHVPLRQQPKATVGCFVWQKSCLAETAR